MNEQVNVDFISKIKSPDVKGLSDFKDEDVVKFGEVFGGKILKSERMNQLRKFLDFLKKIEYHFKQKPEEFKRQEVLILKIYLKNSETKATHELKKGWNSLIQVMDESLNKIRDGKEGYKDLQKLTKMWEAIIAFHQKG